MKRDFGALSNGPFDVLVVGGGVYGAWIAYEAALRGLSVAIVERDDWAASTSSSSSKLLHGGLRYLERFEIGLVRKALKERKLLHELGRHRVRPLRFMLPVYDQSRVAPWKLKAGLWLYDRLAGSKQPVAPHRRHSLADIEQSHAFLDRSRMRAMFSYGDCGTDDARLVLEVIDGALRVGAICVNHARADLMMASSGAVVGATVHDGLSDATVELKATVTVAAMGPWLSGLPEYEGQHERVRLTKGVHLVLPALPTEDAFLFTARVDGRVFFLIPWYGRTLLGTTDTDFRGDPATVGVDEADKAYLLDAIRPYLGDHAWSHDDVRGEFAGLRTLKNEKGRRPSAVSREWLLEIPRSGLIVPLGGKYTSARADACVAVDVVVDQVGKGSRAHATSTRPFPWLPTGDFDAWLRDQSARGVDLGMRASDASQLAYRHGSRVSEVHSLIESERSLSARIVPELGFVRAEVVHAARSEMACTLDDIIRRRIPLSILNPLDDTARADLAALAEVRE